MCLLKNNYIKKILTVIIVFCFTIIFRISISATTNSYMIINEVTANNLNNTVTFKIDNNISKQNCKYGIIISNKDCDLLIDNNNLVKYEIKGNLNKKTSITISIPEEYNYYNMYVKAFAEIDGKVIYSNQIKYIYAEIAGLSKVIINDVVYQNSSLSFTAATIVNNNAEYGLIFSKNQLFTNLDLESAENDQFETEIIKLDIVNENNEFRITVKDIPVYELDVTFKACAYVKNNQTNEVIYTDTITINILDLYYNELINNIDISYNSDYDGIRFETSTIIPNNNNYILGFVFLNKKVDVLDINTPNAYIIEASKEESFAVTMNNIPTSAQDKDIYAVAYLKFINEENEFEYYYSDIYYSSYNKIKETYLINNS